MKWLPAAVTDSVGDVDNSPNVVVTEKAVSMVQSHAYLEHQARRLLPPFTKEAGTHRELAQKARRRAMAKAA